MLGKILARLPERQEVAADLKRKWPAAFFTTLPSALRPPPLIALQPGARWDNKRWPAEHFAELVRALEKKFPFTRFAILGGKDDQPLGEKIAAAAPEKCLNLCGATSLPEMIEWVRRCDLLITNDTGPMHVAAAMGKPLLALFGPTEPRRTGPYGQLQNVLQIELPCSPCMKSDCHFIKPQECLRALTPDAVLQRVQAILS